LGAGAILPLFTGEIMGAVLQRIDDPRDNLDKALPDELYFFAKSKGIANINRAEPADLMRHKLRVAGFIDIPIPNRVLGQPTDWRNEWSTGSKDDPRPSITAAQLLQKQWDDQQGKTNSAPIPQKNPVSELMVDRMSIQELRRECRNRGIKLARTDNLKTLREKLRAA
jgi:hypothetical protein